jgi:hypothetical protein
MSNPLLADALWNLLQSHMVWGSNRTRQGSCGIRLFAFSDEIPALR